MKIFAEFDLIIMFQLRFLKLLSLSVGIATLLGSCEPSNQPFECADAIGCVTIPPGEPIKIGVLQTLSGGSAPGGIDQTRTIELVVEQRNNRLLDRPIILQVEDDRCSPEGGANGALRIVADPQAIAILGTNCSGAAVTAGKIMSEAGLVMISSANTAPSLTAVGNTQGQDWQPGYFRVIYNDATTGKVAAEFARWVLGIDDVATLDMDNLYSQSLTQIFRQSFSNIGGKIVFSGTINPEDTDLKPVLKAVFNSPGKLLFFPFGEPGKGLLLMRQAKSMLDSEEGKNMMFLGGEALMSEQFIGQVGNDGIGIYIAGPALVSSPEIEALESAYQSKYKEPPLTALYSFASDATNLLLDTIAAVAIAEPDGTLHIARQSLREALYSTANFPGLTGKITCDRFGDCGAIKFNIYRLDNPKEGVKGLSRNIVY
ncbi:MAG: branched-chain amino acid ABC transporter substrate-binding protein [Limnospira sp.]